MTAIFNRFTLLVAHVLGGQLLFWTVDVRAFDFDFFWPFFQDNLFERFRMLTLDRKITFWPLWQYFVPDEQLWLSYTWMLHVGILVSTLRHFVRRPKLHLIPNVLAAACDQKKPNKVVGQRNLFPSSSMKSSYSRIASWFPNSHPKLLHCDCFDWSHFPLSVDPQSRFSLAECWSWENRKLVSWSSSVIWKAENAELHTCKFFGAWFLLPNQHNQAEKIRSIDATYLMV